MWGGGGAGAGLAGAGDSRAGGLGATRTGPGSVGWGGRTPPHRSRAQDSTICRTARLGARSAKERGSLRRSGHVPFSEIQRVIASR